MSITLSENHWDCECEKNYIHSVEVLHCPICGSDKEDQPNSRIEEMKEDL